MTDTAVITAVEIARLAGVGRAAVSNWRKRYPDFPQPVGGTTASPAFRLADVETWLKANDKVARLPAQELAWQQIRAISSDHDLPEGVVLAGDLIMSMEHYALSGTRRPGVHALLAERDPEKIVAGMREAMGTLMLVDTPPPVIDGRHVILLRALADLVTEHGTAKAFDLLVDRMHETMRLPRVPQPVAALMVGLLSLVPQRVYDPASGSGSLLSAVLERFPRTWVGGDDTNRALLNIAMLRCLGRNTSGGMYRNGGLRDSLPKTVAADAVVCAPPYGERDWGAEDLAYDPRWRYGVPPRMESELAWLQHALANLRPGGQAVMLMPPAVAARASGRRIRAEMLRAGALRAIIALPVGSAPPHSLGLHLWVLHHPSPSDSANRVLIADLAGSHQPDDVALAWATRTRLLANALAAYTEDTPLPDAPEFTGQVFRVMDLLDDEVDLSPARRLHTEPPPVPGKDVLRLHHDLTDRLEQLPQLAPEFRVLGAPEPLPTITIGDLAKSGAVSVIPGAVSLRRLAVESGPNTTPLLQAKDVAAGYGPSAHLPNERIPTDAVRVRAGDVVVPSTGPHLIARVATDAEDGAVLGTHLFLVRADAALVDSWFLAGFLRRDANTHRASSLGSMQRFDIRRARVPRIPIEDQRPYGVLFQRLAEFDTLLREAAQAGSDMMRLVTDGLAAGTIQPATTAEDPFTARKGNR